MCFNWKMKNFGTIIMLLWSVLWIVRCVPRRKKTETIQKFGERTGEPIAIDDLIRKYERDHQRLYIEEISDGTVLQWPHLENKNLSKYCKQYLQHSVPTRKSDVTAGIKLERKLSYVMENTNIISKVVIVQCKVLYNKPLSFYITRAIKPNCVYALNSTTNGKTRRIHTICNEHCDFEGEPILNRSLKWKWISTVGVTHRRSGQPVARDEYLLQFELEHSKLLKREGKEGKYIGWPHILAQQNLDYYCFQYLGECIPDKNRDGVRGKWKTQILHYQKLDTIEDINVIAVTCESSRAYKLHYHMTRAPEKNCVYSLLPMGTYERSPLVIVYKYCDFEKPDDQHTYSQNTNILVEYLIPKTEVKEETFTPLEILQLLPND